MSGSEEMTAGPVPGVREEVNAFLTREGIPFTGFIHPPIMTVAEGAEIAKRTGGLCCKNLFLKNKKGGFFLLMIPHWKRLDSKELARQIGSARLSFAGEEDLRRLLHLYPGAVSPMGLIFDREGAVQVLLDREIMKHALVDCHPCRNDETLTMTPDDLVNRFMPATGHQVQWVDIPEPEEKPNPDIDKTVRHQLHGFSGGKRCFSLQAAPSHSHRRVSRSRSTVIGASSAVL